MDGLGQDSPSPWRRERDHEHEGQELDPFKYGLIHVIIKSKIGLHQTLVNYLNAVLIDRNQVLEICVKPVC